MVSPNVSEIWQAFSRLSTAEQVELRQLLQVRTATATQAIDAADERRRRNRRDSFQPIELPGGPLSDEIIRNRR